MTINLRDEAGEALLRRQVSTWGDEPHKFLADVQRRSGDEGFVVILEVCGFHDWLLELLPQYGCRDVVLIQPEKKSSRKTDRRDANQLGELLWVNRARLLAGRKVQGLRRIVPPSPADRDDRRLTQLRCSVTAELTRTINRVKYLLRRLNLEQPENLPAAPDLPQVFLEVVGRGQGLIQLQGLAEPPWLSFHRVQILGILQQQPAGPLEDLFLQVVGHLAVERSAELRELVVQQLDHMEPIERS